MKKQQRIISKRYFVFLLCIVMSILIFTAFLKLSNPAVRMRNIKNKSNALSVKVAFAEAKRSAGLKEITSETDSVIEGFKSQKMKYKFFTEEIPDTSGVGILVKKLASSADNFGVEVISIRTDELVGSEVYRELPVEVTVKGGFYQFENYLREIESFKRPLRIDFIQMDSDSKKPPGINVVLSIRAIVRKDW